MATTHEDLVRLLSRLRAAAADLAEAAGSDSRGRHLAAISEAAAALQAERTPARVPSFAELRGLVRDLSGAASMLRGAGGGDPLARFDRDRIAAILSALGRPVAEAAATRAEPQAERSAEGEAEAHDFVSSFDSFRGSGGHAAHPRDAFDEGNALGGGGLDGDPTTPSINGASTTSSTSHGRDAVGGLDGDPTTGS